MKLERLTMTNFLRVRDMELILANSKIHLIAGLNEQGKSTVGEGVRFALLGDTPRIKLKKDYKHLVNREGRKGQISLQFDGMEITRDISSGKSTTETELTEEQQLAIRIALGASSFVDMAEDERRALLWSLTDVKMDGDEIRSA
jgi:DNA repair exonuclease SbcCD ATPase subunit